MAKKRKQSTPDVVHDLSGLIEWRVQKQIYDGTKRKRASLYLVEVRRCGVTTKHAYRGAKSTRQGRSSETVDPGVLVLKIFPNARANEDDYRREVDANAALGRSTAVATPEAACDLMLKVDGDVSSLRWPRCHGTLKVPSSISEGDWFQADETLGACHGILFEYFCGLELLTKEDITEELALEIKQLFADLHELKILHRDHVNHVLWPEVAFHNLFLRINAKTGMKELVILDFDKALILGDTVRDKKLLRDEAERMSDLLEQALKDPMSKTIPKEVQRLLADR